MSKKILIGCYEVAGYGGISTVSYKLFETLRADGLEVHFVNLIDAADVTYFRFVYGETMGNPKGLANVSNCVLDEPLLHPQTRHQNLTTFIQDLSPDLMLGMGYIAALLMKRAALQRRTIFLTASCNQVLAYLTQRDLEATALCDDLKRSALPLRCFHSNERAAVISADLVVTHSDVTRFLCRCFFPDQEGKILQNVVWLAEVIYQDALAYSALQRPFPKRDIDILFVANRWNRVEKNYPLVKKIISRVQDLTIHVAGEVEQRVAPATYHGLLTHREDVFALLGRTKTVVVPSSFDAAPGILFEASAMGCNIVASKNCGNWRLCHDELLVDQLKPNIFEEKIRLSLLRKYQDNMNEFLNSGSYQELKTILQVF